MTVLEPYWRSVANDVGIKLTQAGERRSHLARRPPAADRCSERVRVENRHVASQSHKFIPTFPRFWREELGSVRTSIRNRKKESNVEAGTVKMRRSFFALGLIVHVILVYSVFDVYYSSPLITGLRPHPVTNGVALAKRVVVFSADGLRSTSFYGNPDKSPFLHDIIRNNVGVWGISKSHVPTESRPGHVAMLAGFYEDVSAVTRGWKHNPVEFDSVFNQSRFSYMWGSPDILPMFGHELDHTVMDMYTHEEEDFASKDASRLDRWVFDHVEEFLSSRFSNAALRKKLMEDRQVYFLHLLGIDTNGHGYNPNSKEYVDNIAVVDQGIRETVAQFEKYFNDSRTAYIFTADHGMTDWGSHGAGMDDEILTPFLAWGAGISRSSVKHTINQVDVAPLVSALLGIAVPMNSIGVLPLNVLDAQPHYRYQAACANLKQMVEQYNVRRTERESNALPFMFRDFDGFKASVLNKVQDQVSDLRARRRHDQAARFCLEWVPRVRDALIYFHRYQRFSLGIAIASIFVTWNLTLYTMFVRNPLLPSLDASVYKPEYLTCLALIVGALLVFYQRLPLMNYIYYLLPFYLLGLCYNVYISGREETEPMKQLIAQIWMNVRVGFQVAGVQAIYTAIMFCLPVTVFVAAFFYRAVLSLMLCFLSVMPMIHGNQLNPWASYISTPGLCINIPLYWRYIWSGSCLVLAVFPQLETVGKMPMPWLVLLAPLLAIALLFVFDRYLKELKYPLNHFNKLLLASFALNVISLCSNSAPLIVKVSSWCSIPMIFILPLFASQSVSERVIAWCVAIFLPMSMLTVAYESMFLLVFCVLLFTYVRLEHSHLSDMQFFQLSVNQVVSTKDSVNGPFTLREWQRGLILIALMEMAFFGTGNIASLNSFNPSFLRNFITTFSPFIMFTLLISKMAIPFLVLAFAYAAILNLEQRLFVRLTVLMLIITDSMTMVFFFLLKEEGSWLEIGISISNLLICMGSSAGFFLVLHMANYLLPRTMADVCERFVREADPDV